MALTSCHKDVNDDNLKSVTETQITVPYTFTEIEGTMVGFVYGKDNQPVANALVSIYSASTTTNDYGVFQLSDVKLDGQGTLVIVAKEGYLDGADFVYPNDEGAGTARLKLMEVNSNGAFASVDGGSVEFGDDGLVTFGPNVISQQNGSSYSGDVKTNIRGNYPEEPTFNDDMLGSLIGLDTDGSNKVLGTFGSVHVSLYASSGALLQIKSQQSFVIKFPISQSLLSSAKDEIEVWKYDESSGYWNEIGVAKKEGQFYIIEVSEIGNYMFAEPYSLTHYCAKLVNEADLPAKNYKFNVFVNNKLCATGISDNDGFICTKLPMGEDLNLQIVHPLCNQVLKNITIGPFNEPNNGGDIIIETEQDIRSGSVLCNDNPVSEALIIIRNGATTIVQTTDDSGVFNLNLGDVICSQDQMFDIFAMKDNETSPVLEINQVNMLDIKLEICEPACDYTVSFVFEKLDPCNNGGYDIVNVLTDGGSGQFSYLWSDGGSEISNTALSTGIETCVSVTDLATGCIVNYCEIIQEYRSLELVSISSYNGSCTQNGGVIESAILGGEEPYKYKWESNNGFNSTITNLANVWPGLYKLTVTDANECEINAEIEVYDVTATINYEIIPDCDFSTISILEDEGYGPYTYLWEWEGGKSMSSSISALAAGEYSYTVTDQNECIRTGSVTLGNIGTEVDLNLNYSCSAGSVQYDVLDLTYQYFYESIGLLERFDVAQEDGQVDIPILESGYRYYFGAEDLSVGCDNKELVELPHFEGLQIQGLQNTSCENCTDGFIDVFLDDTEACTGGCVTGELIIIDKLTGADVTNVNAQVELMAGTYIVIVTDENTGCYIAHEEVIIE